MFYFRRLADGGVDVRCAMGQYDRTTYTRVRLTSQEWADLNAEMVGRPD